MAAMKTTAIRDKQTKTQILAEIAEATGLTKKDVQAVLAATRDLAGRHLKKNGSGEFTVPEISVKLARAKRAARKAGMARNPFTGEMVKVEARPAGFSVRARPLKALKDLAEG
ncbi:MAG: HU family DNA-binding protein [Gammaproteobacteria bacterium]|nr:HU family DNA-binding protein [Gammaproteobacteria bacterium]